MVQLPAPSNVAELRSHLGLLGYYRCYVPRFSHMAKPLYKLTQKGVKWDWSAEQKQAYDQLKS
jgi:hypothetical protein